MRNFDEKQFEEIYIEFRKPLFRYISYKVSDKQVAEELLNDLFFKASKSLDTLKEKENLQAWLYKIASNLIIDYYRKTKVKSVEIDEEIHLEEEKEDSIYSELNCCVNDLFNILPKAQAESLKAVYYNEFTQNEYATKNDLNLSTVKSNIKRGKESIKNFFEQCCDFERDNKDQIIKCMHKGSNTPCN